VISFVKCMHQTAIRSDSNESLAETEKKMAEGTRGDNCTKLAYV
jgi:hypothetical protein